jgi:hypothetical protein
LRGSEIEVWFELEEMKGKHKNKKHGSGTVALCLLLPLLVLVVFKTVLLPQVGRCKSLSFS